MVETKDADERGVDPGSTNVIEPFPHDRLFQNMKALQCHHGFPRLNPAAMLYSGKESNFDLRLVSLWNDRIGQASLFDLFMKERGEEKKFSMAKRKTIASFRDPALA